MQTRRLIVLFALVGMLPLYGVSAFGLWIAKDLQFDRIVIEGVLEANRLIVGAAWPLVLVAHLLKTGRTRFFIGYEYRPEMSALLLASLYLCAVPLKGTIGLLDSIVLVVIFASYVRWSVLSRDRRPASGFRISKYVFVALLAAKVNVWTLLIASIPIVHSISAGTLGPIVLGPGQSAELLLTSTQAIFALILILDLEFSWKDALLLFVFFATRPLIPYENINYVYSAIYILLVVFYISRSKILRSGIRHTLRVMWRDKLTDDERRFTMDD